MLLWCCNTLIQGRYETAWHAFTAIRAMQVVLSQINALNANSVLYRDTTSWWKDHRIKSCPITESSFTNLVKLVELNLHVLLNSSNFKVVSIAVFRSAPDIWAIDQLFPIMPIHRLDEEPTEPATLADITCDSDGKIDKFPSPGSFTRLLASASIFPLIWIHHPECFDIVISLRSAKIKPYDCSVRHSILLLTAPIFILDSAEIFSQKQLQHFAYTSWRAILQQDLLTLSKAPAFNWHLLSIQLGV